MALVAEPPMVPFNWCEVPGHSALSGPALTVAAGLICTLTVAEAVAPVPSVTVTPYVPLCAGMVLAREGLWAEELKPPGPLQAKVSGDVPLVTTAVSWSVVPAHRGALEVAETPSACSLAARGGPYRKFRSLEKPCAAHSAHRTKTTQNRGEDRVWLENRLSVRMIQWMI